VSIGLLFKQLNIVHFFSFSVQLPLTEFSGNHALASGNTWPSSATTASSSTATSRSTAVTRQAGRSRTAKKTFPVQTGCSRSTWVWSSTRRKKSFWARRRPKKWSGLWCLIVQVYAGSRTSLALKWTRVKIF